MDLTGNTNKLDEIYQLVENLPNRTSGNETAINNQNKTVEPKTSQQTVTADSGYTGLGTVTVNAIPSTYVKPSATQAAKTWTPGNSDQTIESGTYLSGTQTISGDSNLVASNIKSDVTIFGVTGSYSDSSGTSATVKTATVKPSSASTSISFTGLTGQPKSWSIISETQLTLNTTNVGTRTIIGVHGVHGDETNIYGNCVQATGQFYSAATAYISTAYESTYSNGTFTVTSKANTTGGQFSNSITYRLIYTY